MSINSLWNLLPHPSRFDPYTSRLPSPPRSRLLEITDFVIRQCLRLHSFRCQYFSAFPCAIKEQEDGNHPDQNAEQIGPFARLGRRIIDGMFTPGGSLGSTLPMSRSSWLLVSPINILRQSEMGISTRKPSTWPSANKTSTTLDAWSKFSSLSRFSCVRELLRRLVCRVRPSACRNRRIPPP